MKSRKYFLIILLFTTWSCCVDSSKFGHFKANNIDESQYQTLWEKLCFKEINGRLDGTDLVNLRDINLPENSKEIRIWAGFDLSPLRGIVLKQSDDEWLAYYLAARDSNSEPTDDTIILPDPKSGWHELWGKLDSLEITTLPNATDIGADDDTTDSRSVVAEIKTHTSYRTYRYFNLKHKKEASIVQFQNMLLTLRSE